MKIKYILSTLLFSCSAAYAGDYKSIKREEFKNFGDTPLSHTVYKGSDSKYHYFIWSSGKVSGKWKILKSGMKLGCELEYPQTGSFVIKKNGVYVPWKCKNN